MPPWGIRFRRSEACFTAFRAEWLATEEATLKGRGALLDWTQPGETLAPQDANEILKVCMGWTGVPKRPHNIPPPDASRVDNRRAVHSLVGHVAADASTQVR